MQKYLITSADFYSRDSETFKTRLRKQLQLHMPEYALFRDKENPEYQSLACGFMEVCREFEGLVCIIHSDIKTASALKADGVHLTSTQFAEIPHAKSENLEVIISTHSHEEVLKAQSLGADAVTYSPVFASPDKGEPKGTEDLKALKDKSDIKIFALGGILEPRHVEAVEKTGVQGFASIRYFY
ncbi:thiamine phosphate synthase [bacterium]|nr:thiamine phosphate synthase [bacterium]MBU1989136.1 thiamine phosphate synthase [bacterium]